MLCRALRVAANGEQVFEAARVLVDGGVIPNGTPRRDDTHRRPATCAQPNRPDWAGIASTAARSREVRMSDNSANDTGRESEPTMDGIIAAVEPMGDLGRFRIEDMTADEEDEFFSILDNA